MASRDARSHVQREELLGAVGELAGLESEDAAERATLATLTTLGEHVSAGEAKDIAADLPNGLSGAVTERSDETPESFTADEFVGRVAERERREAIEQGGRGQDVDRAAITRHVRAVIAALADLGLERELMEAREQLPNEFATLFERDELATDAG